MRKTREQRYQAEYYQLNKAKRTRRNKRRWREDPEYRRREQERLAKRRAFERAEKASDRFQAMIEERRDREEVTKLPRFIVIRKRLVQVWSTGDLGREVGRSPRAVRMWLNKGVLPGATVFIKGAAWFSRVFCMAVHRACERLYYLNGRGKRTVLARLVREELVAARISYVPVDGDDGGMAKRVVARRKRR